MAGSSQCELISEQEWDQLQDRLDLSPRQAEIVIELLHAKSDKQIAHDLDMALPTLRTHLGRLFRKFDLNDRTELVLLMLMSLREQWKRDPTCLLNDAAA